MSVVAVSRMLAGDGDPARLVAWTAGRPVTLGELRDEVAALAATLVARGCRRGMLAAHDGYWTTVGLLALLYAGATAMVPQNLRLEGLGTDRWDCLLTDLPESAADSPARERVVPLRRGAGHLAGPLPCLDPTQARLELFTAGSTGAPKVVLKTLEQMEQEAEIVERLLGRGAPPDAPVLGTVPLHHLYGLTFRLFWPLSSGRPMVGRQYEFWESLAAEMPAAAVLVTSPAHLTRFVPPVGAGEGESAVETTLRPSLVLSAGAPLPEPAAEAAREGLDKAVTEIFGSTETGVIAWRQRDLPDPDWTAFDGVAIRANGAGRLSIRSPLLRASEVGADGWYETPDLIEAGRGGGFRLLGRADRIVKVEGKRVSLPELERRLTAGPLVAEAAVLLLEEAAPVLGAVLVLTAAGRAALAARGAFRLGRQLRRELALAQDPSGLPRRWRFVDALPSGALGKRRRADLLALFAPPPPREPELRAVQQLENGVELELFIQPELAQLQGHFPNLPIVPGVAQVDWAVKLAARHLGLPTEAAQSFQVKFRRILRGGSAVTLVLHHRVERRSVSFTYRSGTEIHSSGLFALPAAP